MNSSNRHRAVCRFGFSILTLSILVGCSCEGSQSSEEDLSKPPLPLEAKSVPSGLEVSIHPTIGATEQRPVALVLGSEPDLCTLVVKELEQKSHVLCTYAGPQSAGGKLKEALRYLKKTYPRYVAGPPVVLFAARSHWKEAWRLMLAEGGFFSHSYIEGMEAKVLTSTTLAALQKGGARTLLLQAEETKRLKFLKNIAARRRLSLQFLPESPETRSRAIALLIAATGSKKQEK